MPRRAGPRDKVPDLAEARPGDFTAKPFSPWRTEPQELEVYHPGACGTDCAGARARPASGTDRIKPGQPENGAALEKPATDEGIMRPGFGIPAACAAEHALTAWTCLGLGIPDRDARRAGCGPSPDLCYRAVGAMRVAISPGRPELTVGGGSNE